MKHRDSHLSDQQLLQDLDGELPAADVKSASLHLLECWKCRARRRELETAIGDLVRAHDRHLPAPEGPSALLRSRLAQLSSGRNPGRAARQDYGWALAAIAACICLTGLLAVRANIRFHRQAHSRTLVVSVPDPKLTPGAAVLVSRHAICTQGESNNKAVPSAIQRKVFEAYGIEGAEPREYEVDYLITPALGGADDIHNLWPQSHSSTVWNAEVKDALEDRLRQMVCEGSLDLTEAQQEIAANWIDAYKKYFHTNTPVTYH